MPARLFRRIQFLFSRLNKTLLLSAVVFLFAVFFIGIPAVKADSPDCTAVACTAPQLKEAYAPWANLLTANITKVALQQSTSNNDGNGIVITMDLALNPSGTDTLEKAWERTNLTTTNSAAQTFVAELCDSKNNCWLSTIPADENNDNGGNIAEKDSSGEYTDSEKGLSFSAFSANAGQSTTVSTGSPYGGPATTNFTQGGQLYRYNTSDSTTTSIPNLTLPQGSVVNITEWYCATGAGAKAATAYKNAGLTNPNIATFGTLCGGNTYYQMTPSTYQYTVPNTAAGVQQDAQAGQQALTKQATVSSSNDSNLPACGIMWGQNGTINGCAAQLAYGIYELCAWIAGLMGQLFDFFIGYSLSDASYRYAFAVTGWQLVRDISNIFFILIMVWTGFAAVFDTEHSSVKSVVPQLIINAILINFSLFATRLVIDISNVTARIFYSQMVVCQQAAIKAAGGTCTAAQADRTGPGGYWKLSAKIVSSFDPEKLFAPSILQPPNFNASNDKISGANSVSNFSSQQVGSGASVLSERDYANYFGIICILASIIMIAIAGMFFKTSFLFIGRVVGLYICMIFSPFAFLSLQIPFFKKMTTLRWDDWKDELINYALLAPVFVFLLYIIYILLTSDFAAQMATVAANSNSVMEVILSIAIPMVIIYMLITKAVDIAKSLSGDMGKRLQGVTDKISGLAGAAGGIALGIATDGASLAATRTTKLTALSDNKRAELEARKAAGGFSGWRAKQRIKASDWTQKQDFNFRNTSAYQNATKKLGITTNEKVLGALGFGKDVTKGGREAMLKRSEDVTNKKIGSIKTNMDETKIEEFWANHRGKQIDKLATDTYFNEKMKAATTDAEKKALKASRKDGTFRSDARYTQLVADGKKVSEDTYGKVKNNKQLTKALQTEYAATLLNQKDFGQNPEFDIPRAIGLGGAGTVGTILGAGAAGAIGGIGMVGLAAKMSTEDEGRRKAAKKYLDASAKELKKGQDKEARKENQKKSLEAQSKSAAQKLDKYEDGIAEALLAHVSAKINDKGNAAYNTKSAEERQQLINAEVARLKLEENSEDASKTLKEFRDNLKNTFEMINLDLNNLNADHKDTARVISDTKAKLDSDNTKDKDKPALQKKLEEAKKKEENLRKDISAKLAERSSNDEQYKNTDPGLRDTFRSNKTRIENQIDQIEEKEENAKKAASEAESKSKEQK